MLRGVGSGVCAKRDVCSEGCGLECALRGMSGMCAQRGVVWSVLISSFVRVFQ